MRRLFVLLLVVGLAGSVAGCRHLAGSCDCADGYGCGAGSPLTGTPMLWMSAAPADGPVTVEATTPHAAGAHVVQPATAVTAADAPH
jgi:hypothetical protein